MAHGVLELMIPVSLMMGWLKSVTYVSALSLWALVSGHWSTWQAARVEVTQQKEAEERLSEPIEDKVVEKLVEETNIRPAASQLRGANYRSHSYLKGAPYSK